MHGCARGRRSNRPNRPSVVVAHQIDEAKRASNINAHDVFPHAPNVIRGELLKVFSNNGVGAPDIDPPGGDGEMS